MDGTSALVGNRGYLFLFNPNGRRLNAEFALDSSIGLETGDRFILKEWAPLEGRLIGKAGAGYWRFGDRVSIPVDGTTAMVIEVLPVPEQDGGPVLFGAPGRAALSGGVLELSGVRGEAGAQQDLLVALPSGSTVQSVTANGRVLAHPQVQPGFVGVRVRFAGAPFRHSQPVEVGATSDGILAGRFSIPTRVFEQLHERKERWPIPWTPDDYRTTWLVPERLLLFVQMAEPDDRMQASLRLDGRDFPLQKAYSSVRPHGPSFVGFYADLSSLEPSHEYALELKLPKLAPGRLQGVFFDNVETEYTGAIER